MSLTGGGFLFVGSKPANFMVEIDAPECWGGLQYNITHKMKVLNNVSSFHVASEFLVNEQCPQPRNPLKVDIRFSVISLRN